MLKTVSFTSSIFAVAIITGCSGAPQGGNAGLPGAILPSGVDTRYAPSAPLRSQALPVSPLTIERKFFISDAVSTVFTFSNSTDKLVGKITTGISCPDGLWVDKKGNLYVANACGANVTEYRQGLGSPICTYSTGLVNPINVTTDATGNVYVVDLNNFSYPGYIDKFAQCSNTIAKQYLVNRPIGVAVDTAGDMFVSYAVSGSKLGGYFEEFKAGSSTPTSLGATVSGAGGLVLDKNRNLITDDQGTTSTGSIDVIAPPYNSAKVLVSGLNDPSHVSLNAAETKLFNANQIGKTVTIYSYPAGSLLKTIGASSGIDGVEGVAESPNAVF